MGICTQINSTDINIFSSNLKTIDSYLYVLLTLLIIYIYFPSCNCILIPVGWCKKEKNAMNYDEPKK